MPLIALTASDTAAPTVPSGSIENDDLPDRVAGGEPLETLVDVVKLDAMGHQAFDRHGARLHQSGETRYVANGNAGSHI